MERLVLDPIEVAYRRTEVDITSYVAQAGPDFGDAEIEQYLADAQIGQIPVDFRYPPRTVTIPLLLRDDAAHTFNELRRLFQQKTGMFQREGGWIKRQTSLGPLYGDITGAQLKLGGSTAQALWGIDADAILTLTMLPDWYGDEEVMTVVSNPSNATDLIYTLSGMVDGNVPARSRLILKDLSTIDFHGLLWGVRSRYYDSSATAQLSYDAEALTPVAPAAINANAAASSGSEVRIASLSNNWTAILSTDVAGVGSLTHVGTYRVWARCRTEVDPLYPSTLTAPRVRLVWDVGDLIQPVENEAIRLPLDADFFLADLGEIRIDRAPIGAHRWQGMIQATEGYKPFAIDKIWFQPLDDAAGRLSISPVASVGLSGYSARDPFDSDLATGLIAAAQPLPVGGNWTFSHGDTDDFFWDGSNFRLKRSTISDTAARFVYASGPTMAATAGQIDFYISATASTSTAVQAFLMFRRVDANNYGYVTVGSFEDGQGTRERVYIGAVVGGTPVTLGLSYIPQFLGQWWTLRIAVTPLGYIFAWVFPQGSALPPDPTVLRYDPSHFATGQALASGKLGFGDYNGGTGGGVRYYNNFLAWTPDDDAVIFAGRSAELRYDGMYREAPGGSNYSAMGTVLGDLMRVPPSGLEARPTEIFLKPSFGDLIQASDSQLLRLQAEMRIRPCYLFVPEG